MSDVPEQHEAHSQNNPEPSDYQLYCRLLAQGALTKGSWVVIHEGTHAECDTWVSAIDYAEKLRIHPDGRNPFIMQVIDGAWARSDGPNSPDCVLFDVAEKDDATAIQEMKDQCEVYQLNISKTRTRMMNHIHILREEMQR